MSKRLLGSILDYLPDKFQTGENHFKKDNECLMTKTNPFHGIICPILTPFDANGEIDYKSLEKLIEFLISESIPCLMVGGTTGEGPLLSVEERKKIAEAVLSYANKRVRVIVHVSCLSTKESIELTKHAQSIGVDGISAITPFFFSYSDEEVFRFYEAISKTAPEIPISLYCFPGNAKFEIKGPLLIRILQNLSNVKAIKSSNTDLIRLQEYISVGNNDFSVLCGVDALALPALTLGACGQVSGNSNIFPQPFIKLYQSYKKGDLESAAKCQSIINRIRTVLKDSIAYFKAASEINGLPVGIPRLPIQPLGESEINSLKSEISKLKFS